VTLVTARPRNSRSTLLLDYLTANSCKHDGYLNYTWPAEWGDDVLRYGALPDCEGVPEDGNGVPEQVREIETRPILPPHSC